MGYRRVATEPVVKPLRTTRSQRRTEEYTPIAYWAVEDDDGGEWWLVEPNQAVIYDPKFAGWQLVGPRIIRHGHYGRSTFGDPFMALPHKFVKGDVELTWDGETWAGVPGGPPDDVLKVMQAAWTGSAIGGQPDTKGELLERIRAVVRDRLLKHPDERPLEQDVATAVEGLDPYAVPGSTFRRAVKKGGSWDAIIEAEREALDQF
jgi:hypothetical protein